jgi:hypothetical protein
MPGHPQRLILVTKFNQIKSNPCVWSVVCVRARECAVLRDTPGAPSSIPCRRHVVRPEKAVIARWQALVRQRREAEDSASKFGIQTEVHAGADLAAIPDRLQGDLSLYSNAALEARKKLKHNKDLRRWIDKHWERLVVDKPDGARRVTFPEYAGTFTAFLRCVGLRRLCARERVMGAFALVAGSRVLAPETRKHEAWKIMQASRAEPRGSWLCRGGGNDRVCVCVRARAECRRSLRTTRARSRRWTTGTFTMRCLS